MPTSNASESSLHSHNGQKEQRICNDLIEALDEVQQVQLGLTGILIHLRTWAEQSGAIASSSQNLKYTWLQIG